MTRTTWLALACAMTMACGGKTVGGAEGDGGGGAGGDASPGGPDGGTSAGDSGIVAHDASTTRDTGAPLGCVQGPGSGSGGQGSCGDQRLRDVQRRDDVPGQLLVPGGLVLLLGDVEHGRVERRRHSLRRVPRQLSQPVAGVRRVRLPAVTRPPRAYLCLRTTASGTVQ